jgi:hypothetical protein
MTVDEFMNGRLLGRERIDNGTGLSKTSVISGLRAAVSRKTIEIDVDDSDKARIRKRYRLKGIIDRPERSKIQTPGVQKIDPEHNKDTSKESSSPSPSKRKQTERDRFSTAMEQRFSKVSGVPRPDLSTVKAKKRANVLWFTPLWALYKLHRPEEERTGEAKLQYDPQDLDTTLQLIDAAVQHVKEAKLTLSSPRSIEQVAISIFAEGNYRSTEASIDFWKQFV